MADIEELWSLQAQLNSNLQSLMTANAANSVMIRQNIANLRRQINRLLYIMNFQMDAVADRRQMPPPPNPKI